MDLSLRLLRHGYDAVAADRAAHGVPPDAGAHATRLVGRRAVVVRSEAGVRFFYDESAAERKGVVPPPLGWLLFGRGALHGLDGDPHRDRKRVMVDVLSADGLGPMVARVTDELEAATTGWPGREVTVHPTLVSAYGRAVLRWAGLDVDDERADMLARRLAQQVDGFGFAGPAYARGWASRLWWDRWASRLVGDLRSGRAGVPDDAPAMRLVRGIDGDDRTAAVELGNVLRPTIAVSWLGTFAALRLAGLPQWRERLADPGEELARMAFAQEVRRTTPFAPVLAARATRPATLDGVRVRRGDRLVLDIMGVDHDPARWEAPHEFRPERFLTHAPGAYDLVPQGGGHPAGHRCPGESLTLRVLEATLRVLATVPYDVVDPGVDLTRMPTTPRDGLRIRVPAGAPHRSGRASIPGSA
ncbi:cytochrome P450 [Nocardioides abyssi]|uniref:Cytochrome P450 n=1 Tax=Nocardioides abyssi TaxID=3058370 RepID=A0ABT8EQX5_9ACTN|nr:cytochrome P450 [Nocardioides abyssi]MDN4160413.1 cytochrome P450 [Nocardioides abyssi]